MKDPSARKKSLKKRKIGAPQGLYENEEIDHYEGHYSNKISNEEGAQEGTEESDGEHEGSLEGVNVDDTNFKVQSQNETPQHRISGAQRRNLPGAQMQYSDEGEGEDTIEEGANQELVYMQQR